MNTPNERLKLIRSEAGYGTASDAARAHKEINVNTLISHENGNRAISRKAAEKYAEIFGRTAGWILFGEDAAGDDFETLYLSLNEDQKKQVLSFMTFLKSGQSNRL
ncbi:hypothetical protein ACLBWZ_09030 [Brucellaceae bacterium C25G]